MRKHTLLKKLTIGVASLALICPLALGGVSQSVSAKRRPRTHRVSNYGLSTGAAKRAVKKAYNRRTFVVPYLHVTSAYGNTVNLKAHFGAEANIFFHVTKSGNQAHIHTAIKTNTGWASRSYYRTYGIRRNAKAQLYRTHQARRVYKPRRTVKRHARIRRHAKRYNHKRNSKRANNKKRVIKRNHKARKHIKRAHHHSNKSQEDWLQETEQNEQQNQPTPQKQTDHRDSASWYLHHGKGLYRDNMSTNSDFRNGWNDEIQGKMDPNSMNNNDYRNGWIIDSGTYNWNYDYPATKSTYQRAIDNYNLGVKYINENPPKNGDSSQTHYYLANNYDWQHEDMN